MELVMTTGAIRRAKLQVNHHQQHTNIQHFTGRMPNQQCQSGVCFLISIDSEVIDLTTREHASLSLAQQTSFNL